MRIKVLTVSRQFSLIFEVNMYILKKIHQREIIFVNLDGKSLLTKKITSNKNRQTIDCAKKFRFVLQNLSERKLVFRVALY